MLVSVVHYAKRTCARSVMLLINEMSLRVITQARRAWVNVKYGAAIDSVVASCVAIASAEVLADCL